MIVDIHPIFRHTSIEPLIHVVGEGDGVLLRTSHHWDAEDVGIEIEHVRDRRIPLVERVAFSNEQLNSFLIKCQRVRRRTGLLQRLDLQAKYQLVGWPCPPGFRKCETRPSRPRLQATRFFCKKSLVFNLAVKGTLSG